MKIDIIDYSLIIPNYKMAQPAWLKVIVLLIALATLFLGGYLAVSLQKNMIMTSGLALIVIVFCVGFIKQISSGIWSPLLANKEAIYIIASVDGKKFIQIPWPYLHDIKSRMYGLNKRGLIINLNAELLSNVERDLVRNHLNVPEEKINHISISIPTGIVNRDKAIQQLQKI